MRESPWEQAFLNISTKSFRGIQMEEGLQVISRRSFNGSTNLWCEEVLWKTNRKPLGSALCGPQ
jgi:hypothetical protein